MGVTGTERRYLYFVEADKLASAFYGYYFVKTDCLSNTWNTKDIEGYLINKGFISERMGGYQLKSCFLSLNLMLVKNYDSWSSNDYNRDETNYIDIVTSKGLHPTAEQFFRDFEIFIGRRVIEETDDD